jgi:hypothetical protein
MARANTQIRLTQEDRLQLESMARSKSLPHGLVQRAQIVLMSAEGLGGTEVARRTRTTKSQVQALERTQPVLPMGLGYLAWHGRDA